MANAAGDPLVFSALTRLLRRYGLARIESAALQLHRLLAAILRAQSPQRDLPALVVSLLRTAIPPGDPWDNPPVWPAWRQLLPHLLVAIGPHRSLTGAELDVAWLLHHAATYLNARGEAAPALPLFERALDLRRARLGEDHPHTLASASSLTLALWELGRYERGCQLGEDTLTRSRQTLGEDHPVTLESAANLAWVLWALGQYERACQLGEDTLTRSRQTLGKDHPYTLRLAHDLTAVLANLDEHGQPR
jgi:tetratricopeptide (TPR) repeat protein